VVLTGGPHPSAAREKEGEGRGSAGPGPRRRKGARGLLGHKAKKKEGEERKAFLFFIFQTKFPNEFLNSNNFLQTTHHIKEVHQHVCNNVFLIFY